MDRSERLHNALRSAYARPRVIAVEFGIVKDGDDFHFVRGLEPKLHHVPADLTDQTTHAWAVVNRQVGNTTVKVFSVQALVVEQPVSDEELAATAIEDAAHLIPDEEDAA